jgi:O-antigen biosynthesis protein
MGKVGVSRCINYFAASQPELFGRARLRKLYFAVTAACLLVRRDVYYAVGGLDDVNLKIAFNDVDFCLKVRALGLRNVWTPFAELYHHESATRGYENTPEKKARFEQEARFMTAKWGDALLRDPAYNPNLSLDRNDCGLALQSRLPAFLTPR